MEIFSQEEKSFLECLLTKKISKNEASQKVKYFQNITDPNIKNEESPTVKKFFFFNKECSEIKIGIILS